MHTAQFVVFIMSVLCLTTQCRVDSSKVEQTPAQKDNKAISRNSETPDNSSAQADSRNYHGCWIGQKRGALEIDRKIIRELTSDRSTAKQYVFEEKLISEVNTENPRYLLELQTDPALFCLERVIVAEVTESGELHIDNYYSLDDYKNGKRAEFCNLVRVECE